MPSPADEQWTTPQIPEAAPPHPDVNPPLRELPPWMYLLWGVVILACLGSPIAALITSLLGGLVFAPVLLVGAIGLFVLALILTLVMLHQIRSPQ